MKKILSMILVVAIVMSMVTIVSAEDTTVTYTLDATADLPAMAAGDKADGDTEVYKDYFTIHFAAKTKIDSSKKTFEDGYAGTQRLNFQSEKCFIEFTTQGAAKVKIWWVVGDAGREFVIKDSADQQIDATAVNGAKNDLAISELSIPSAGTYTLKLATKSNYLFKLEVTETIPASEPDEPVEGSQELPYTEFYMGEPITSAEIPAASNVYYDIYGVGDMILTIEDADAYVIYAGETYNAVDGVVTVQLGSAMGRMPVSMQIGNNGEAAESYTLNFEYPLGSYMNPEILDELGWLTTSLAEGDQDGYYYQYTVPADGSASFQIFSATEGTECDIVVTNQNSSAQRSLSADGAADEYGTTVLNMDVAAGDVLLIQMISVPDASYNNPASELETVNSFTAVPGSEQNPIWLQEMENTVTIPAGSTVYYQGYFSGTTMEISSDAAFSASYNGSTLTPTEGKVSTPVSSPNPRMPVVFSVTNSSDAEASFQINFVYPEGTYMNPADLVIGDNEASLEEGNDQGYYFSYTADKPGKLVITPSCSTEGVEYEVIVMHNQTYAQNLLSESTDGTVTMVVAKDDTVTVQVVVMPDMTTWTYPAADVTVKFELTDIFPDVPHDSFWAENEIAYMVSRGYISGKLDGTFGLGNVQRRTIAMMLWRLAGEPEPTGASPFSDMQDTNDRYYNAVIWAYENNIIAGYRDGTFRGQNDISREHFAAFLSRYANYASLNLTETSDKQITDFTDYATMSTTMHEAIQWAVSTGMIAGRSDGRFDPAGLLSRAQMAVILYRFLMASAA